MSDKCNLKDCLKGANEALAEKNAKLKTTYVYPGGERITLAIEKIDKSKRGSLPNLFPQFCPFCGKEIHQG